MSTSIASSLQLPCGALLPNRLAKAAMEENMATPGQLPGAALYRLYDAWAQGGAGLIITGNVMIDARALTGPGGVVLEASTPLAPFQAWSRAATTHGSQVWMQINHPGRQVRADMGCVAWAPSAVALELGPYSSLFPAPRAMSDEEIREIIRRFGDTAVAAQAAGFHGVQIHAAHGYLISQFLSPLTNLRDDDWGGSPEKRARLLLDVVREVRARVKPSFAVAVKLNSADFQKGGFSADDALQVVQWLNALAVDLVELSGGSYESPAMQGTVADGSTLAREAYFLAFASQIRCAARMPIMTTGGIRRLAVAQNVLAQGVDIVGMATALALQPDLPRRWLQGEAAEVTPVQVNFKDKIKASVARMALIKRSLQAWGSGKNGASSFSTLLSLVLDQIQTRRLTTRYKKWMRTQSS
jgi:2,4-dienoyl-CoA reductase-like NADH-dependent reductase (Old Yellow Enzyme family)